MRKLHPQQPQKVFYAECEGKPNPERSIFGLSVKEHLFSAGFDRKQMFFRIGDSTTCVL